jgi:hypothetical protein
MIEMALLTAEEAPLRTAHLCGRHTSDLMMMTMFGDGKERNREQFAALLAASGGCGLPAARCRLLAAGNNCRRRAKHVAVSHPPAAVATQL